MPDFEITKRELLVSISIFAVLISISIAFSSKIERLQTDANIKYETALQIDNNPEQYKYAFETDVGNVFAMVLCKQKILLVLMMFMVCMCQENLKNIHSIPE